MILITFLAVSGAGQASCLDESEFDTSVPQNDQMRTYLSVSFQKSDANIVLGSLNTPRMTEQRGLQGTSKDDQSDTCSIASGPYYAPGSSLRSRKEMPDKPISSEFERYGKESLILFLIGGDLRVPWSIDRRTIALYRRATLPTIAPSISTSSPRMCDAWE